MDERVAVPVLHPQGLKRDRPPSLGAGLLLLAKAAYFLARIFLPGRSGVVSTLPPYPPSPTNVGRTDAQRLGLGQVIGEF